MSKKTDAPPPPWGDEGAEEWINKKLGTRRVLPRTWFYSGPDAEEVEAAEAGDIGPLQEKYPHLARYLHEPELSPGQNFNQFDPRLQAADAELPKVRALLRKYKSYLSKKITAEKILVKRWRLNDNQMTAQAISKRKLNPRNLYSEYGRRAGLVDFIDPERIITSNSKTRR